MNLQPRHTQILTILKNHKDGLSTADIFKISQTMVGNEIPKHQGTDTVSKLVYSLRGSHMITTHEAGKTKIYKLSPLGHEALLKSDDEFEMPAAPVLPKTEAVKKKAITVDLNDCVETANEPEKVEVTLTPTSIKEVEENNACFILNRDGFYSPLFEMVNRFEHKFKQQEKEIELQWLKPGVYMLEEKLELLEEIASAKFIDEDRANYLRDIADDLRQAA